MSVHPGKAIVTVSDVRNADHFDQAIVSIQILYTMYIHLMYSLRTHLFASI